MLLDHSAFTLSLQIDHKMPSPGLLPASNILGLKSLFPFMPVYVQIAPVSFA